MFPQHCRFPHRTEPPCRMQAGLHGCSVVPHGQVQAAMARACACNVNWEGMWLLRQLGWMCSMICSIESARAYGLGVALESGRICHNGVLRLCCNTRCLIPQVVSAYRSSGHVASTCVTKGLSQRQESVCLRAPVCTRILVLLGV